jgi:hypothetical protein
MQVGQRIVFDLHTWPDGNEMVMEEKTAEILSFCHDPLQRHESKCCVFVNSQELGIPFSEVKNVLPGKYEQLALF